MPLLFLLLLWPFLEIEVFITVTRLIGLWDTLGLLVLSALIGGGIVARQGLMTLGLLEATLRKSRLPATEVFDGLCRFAAGLLFILPGFISDGIAVLLLLPSIRRFIQYGLAESFLGDKPGGVQAGDAIDGEFTVVVDPEDAATGTDGPGTSSGSLDSPPKSP